MELIDVMSKGCVLIACDVRQEYVVSWDLQTKMQLWSETHGQLQELECRELTKKPSCIEEAVMQAERLILDLEEV